MFDPLLPAIIAWALAGNYFAFQIADDRQLVRDFQGMRGVLAVAAALWPLWLLLALFDRLKGLVK